MAVRAIRAVVGCEPCSVWGTATGAAARAGEAVASGAPRSSLRATCSSLRASPPPGLRDRPPVQQSYATTLRPYATTARPSATAARSCATAARSCADGVPSCAGSGRCLRMRCARPLECQLVRTPCVIRTGRAWWVGRVRSPLASSGVSATPSKEGAKWAFSGGYGLGRCALRHTPSRMAQPCPYPPWTVLRSRDPVRDPDLGTRPKSGWVQGSWGLRDTSAGVMWTPGNPVARKSGRGRPSHRRKRPPPPAGAAARHQRARVGRGGPGNRAIRRYGTQQGLRAGGWTHDVAA